MIPQIFEPFFSTKGLAEKPGTGLGLSTVFGFIKQSQGNIGVKSEVGTGTTFRLLLPRLVEAMPAPGDLPVAQSPHVGHETVLVVEDNEALRRLVVRQIEHLGYRVMQAGTAAAALAILAENRVDLLFSDIILPGEMDGRQLARTARAHWPSVKVLLTTGFGDMTSRGNDRGMRVLDKPYQTAALAEALRDILNAEDMQIC